MDETRSKLLDIQAMTPPNATPDLLDKEKEAPEDMYKWLSIQEKINKQKSKAHWIVERDGNNKYFFNCMKARASTNNISMLKGENGTLLHKQTEIEIEILNYYKGLLGAAVETLPAVNLNIMRQGPSLSQQQQRDMCTKITMEEIEIDLFDINDNKTPWIDGFNAYFFKKTWRIVQNDIYKVVLDFFQHNKLLRAVNYTMVTLIPKNSHPETVRDFRPIACCSTLYKIISKIISNRIKGLIDTLWDNSNQHSYLADLSQTTSYLVMN